MYSDTFSIFPVIETDRLLLRQLEITDIDDIFEYAKDKENFTYTDGFPHEYEEIKNAVNLWRYDAYNSKQFIRWGIELKEEKRIIGGVYLYAPCGNDNSGRRMDIGYEISKKYWSMGYASEAIRAVCNHGIRNMGLVRIQAQIMPENIGSIRACEKAGLVKEGILRNYCHYQRNGNKLNTVVMMSYTVNKKNIVQDQIMETDRLIIRRFTPDDWQDLYEYLSDEKVVEFEPYSIFSKEEAIKETERRSRNDSFWAVCLKDNKKLIGNIYFCQQEPKKFMTWEIGYVFNRQYGGKGYATESALRMLRYGFEECNAHRIAAHCNPENKSSWRLLERLNMRREGHFLQKAFFKLDVHGRPIWHDAYEYAILSEEWINR